MASAQPSGSTPSAQEFTVRLRKDRKKKYSILKLHHSLKSDLTKCGSVKLERENNLKEYKLSHDLDTQPTSGAGSEFGREQRDEARRKKYGIYIKKYDPESQPWLLKLGDGKQAKKFKGTKEGGIGDNVSYYVFTQCTDGAFEAFPVEEWYHFTPQVKYKCLTSEEAEEEFNRRDKTMNYFSIMVNKRMNVTDEGDAEDEKEKKNVKKSKKKSGFHLTEMDEWAVMSDGDVEGDSEEETVPTEGKSKKGKAKKKSKKSMKTNSGDEALEESDSFDEGHEVDYMTDSGSNSEGMYEEKKGGEDDEEDKYEEKGVEDEDGLKKLINSDDEEEEDAEKRQEDADEESREAREAREKEKKDDSDDNSSSSGSESDPEKEIGSFSAFFMQNAEKKKSTESSQESSQNKSSTGTEEKAKKRKAEPDSVAHKKAKVESPTITAASSSASFISSEGITEEAVRRYLMRKPITTKDLVQKFKNTGLSKDQLVTTIAKILKRIDPVKTKTKDKLFLSLKSDKQ